MARITKADLQQKVKELEEELRLTHREVIELKTIIRMYKQFSAAATNNTLLMTIQRVAAALGDAYQRR